MCFYGIKLCYAYLPFPTFEMYHAGYSQGRGFGGVLAYQKRELNSGIQRIAGQKAYRSGKSKSKKLIKPKIKKKRKSSKSSFKKKSKSVSSKALKFPARKSHSSKIKRTKKTKKTVLASPKPQLMGLV